MFTHGLYQHNQKKEAYENIRDIYSLCMDSDTAMIFPGLPSYFAPGDRGRYSYLTGSSTWMVLTITTEMFGVKGSWGNLCLQPKLSPSYFDDKGEAKIECSFAGKRLLVTYKLKQAEANYPYNLADVKINGQEPEILEKEKTKFVITKSELERLCTAEVNEVIVTLKGVAS